MKKLAKIMSYIIKRDGININLHKEFFEGIFIESLSHFFHAGNP